MVSQEKDELTAPPNEATFYYFRQQPNLQSLINVKIHKILTKRHPNYLKTVTF